MGRVNTPLFIICCACHCHVGIFGAAQELLATAAGGAWTPPPLMQHQSPPGTRKSCWAKAAKSLFYKKKVIFFYFIAPKLFFYPNFLLQQVPLLKCGSAHKLCVSWDSGGIISGCTWAWVRSHWLQLVRRLGELLEMSCSQQLPWKGHWELLDCWVVTPCLFPSWSLDLLCSWFVGFSQAFLYRNEYSV